MSFRLVINIMLSSLAVYAVYVLLREQRRMGGPRTRSHGGFNGTSPSTDSTPEKAAKLGMSVQDRPSGSTTRSAR
jgi:hypothetical protein